MKYPWIEKLNLKLHEILSNELHTDNRFSSYYVRASDLETLLESAQTVYGQMHSEINGSFTTEKMPEKQSWGLKHTHSAKLICIEKIKKGVTKAQIVRALRGEVFGCEALANRIESEGIID